MTEHDSDLLKICPLFDLREIPRKRWLFLFYGAPEDYYLVVSTLWLAEGVSFWECITNTYFISKWKDLRIIPRAEYFINVISSRPDVFNTGIYCLVGIDNIIILLLQI